MILERSARARDAHKNGAQLLQLFPQSTLTWSYALSLMSTDRVPTPRGAGSRFRGQASRIKTHFALTVMLVLASGPVVVHGGWRVGRLGPEGAHRERLARRRLRLLLLLLRRRAGGGRFLGRLPRPGELQAVFGADSSRDGGSKGRRETRSHLWQGPAER